MFKKKFVLALVSLLAAYSVSAADIEVGILHEDVILSHLETNFMSMLTKKFTNQRKSMVALEQKFQRKKDEFDKNKLVMDNDSLQKNELTLRQLERQLTMIRDNLHDEIDQERQIWLAGKIQTVQKQVQKIAEAHHISIVLSDKAIIYSKKPIDITQEVLKALPKS